MPPSVYILVKEINDGTTLSEYELLEASCNKENVISDARRLQQEMVNSKNKSSNDYICWSLGNSYFCGPKTKTGYTCYKVLDKPVIVI